MGWAGITHGCDVGKASGVCWSMMWHSNISMLDLKRLLLIALRTVLEGWKMELERWRRKKSFGGESCLCSYATTTAGLAPACGSRKNSGVSLLWQAYHGSVGSTPICVFSKEGTHGPATWFPQLVEISIEQLNASIDNVAAHQKPDMVLRPQALHTHCTGVILLDHSQAEILPWRKGPL